MGMVGTGMAIFLIIVSSILGSASYWILFYTLYKYERDLQAARYRAGSNLSPRSVTEISEIRQFYNDGTTVRKLRLVRWE